MSSVPNPRVLLVGLGGGACISVLSLSLSSPSLSLSLLSLSLSVSPSSLVYLQLSMCNRANIKRAHGSWKWPGCVVSCDVGSLPLFFSSSFPKMVSGRCRNWSPRSLLFAFSLSSSVCMCARAYINLCCVCCRPCGVGGSGIYGVSQAAAPQPSHPCRHALSLHSPRC